MCVRILSAQDLRDFFTDEWRRHIVARAILDEIVSWPSCELVDLIIDEFINEEGEHNLGKSYQGLRHVWGLMEEWRLDGKLETFLCERYGYRSPEDDRVVSCQEALDELLEAENGQTDVHP